MLIDKLNYIMDKIEDLYEWVNHGGCGVVATHLAKRLQERGIEVQIRVMDDRWFSAGPKNLNEIDVPKGASLLDWNKEGVYFTHVVVCFEYNNEEYAIDSSGCYTLREFKINHASWFFHEGHLTLKQAEDAVKNTEGWNPRFPRQQIRGIRHTITRTLNQLNIAA